MYLKREGSRGVDIYHLGRIKIMEQQINVFMNSLLKVTGNIEEKYFQLPVTCKGIIYRERGYCYDLYHQIRKFLHLDYP